MGQRSDAETVVSVNRKARHDYLIEETYEAGLVLTGSEVKSLRAGRVNLRDSHARITRGEAFLVGTHISPYGPAVHTGHEPVRPRKLLLHKREIARLVGKVKERGLTLVPLRLYFKGPRAKVELALARGKKQYDKRAALREKASRREAERVMAGRRRHETREP
jgi:SsrA-binding protein